MKATIYIAGKIGEDTTLLDVIRQIKSFEDVTEVEAVINSIGGKVNEGEAIYSYLKGLDAETPVTTVAEKAYSIAAKIFTSGSTRIVEDADKALMIHNPWVTVSGDAEKLEDFAEQMRVIEEGFEAFYSEFLEVDAEAVGRLLEKETFISGSEAVELGFATELKAVAQAVAEYNIENSNLKTMTDKKDQKSKGRALLQAMAAFVGIELETNEEVPANAALTLQDSSGVEIEFPDLESGDSPKVGDKATIDGAAIEDGSYIMPSLEEVTVVFVGGVITEIIEKEEESAEADEEAQAAEKPDANAEEVQQISVWTMEVTNTSFEVGDVVKYKDWEDNNVTIGAGEYQLGDGRRVVTDATGVIVTIKEAEAPKEVEVDAEASFEDLLDKITKKVTDKIEASHKAEIEKKDNEILNLKKQIGSEEVVAEVQEDEVEGKNKRRPLNEILRNAKK